MEPDNSQKGSKYTTGIDNWDFENWECESQLTISKIWKKQKKKTKKQMQKQELENVHK